LFETIPYTGYQCPMNGFDTWLQAESAKADDDKSSGYTTYCNSASELPMGNTDDFDGCMIAYSREAGNRDILQHDGKVRVIIARVQTTVPKSQEFETLSDEYDKYEDYMSFARENAPTGVDNFFYYNRGFLVFKSCESIGEVAVGSIVSSLIFVALVVLFSSSSFELMFMSIVTIGFIMAAVICILYGLDWQLGT